MLKRYLPKSLYARVLLIVILPIFLMQSVVTYVFFERHWEAVSASLSANTAGQIALVTRLYGEAADEVARKAVEAEALDDLDISVRFEPGGLVPAADDKNSPFDLYAATFRRRLDERLDASFWVNTRSWPAYVEVRVQTEDGALVFLPRRDRVFATNGWIFLAWLVAATILLGTVGVLFLKNQVRSILRLAEAAEAFGRGRDIPNFRPSGATEVRRAGRAFIAMRERIRRHLHQRTAMLAGFSHDLRTPLTRMKLALVMMPDTADVAALRGDVGEMERMVDAYLAYARDISAVGTSETVDVSALAAAAAAESARAGLPVDTAIEPGLFVSARADALRRAVANLLDNARKYARSATITVRRIDDLVEIAVDDDGPGVPAAQFEEAFKPFVRLEPGKGRGVGLGLAIVREVARGHGGEATLSTSARGGLCASIRLPASSPDDDPATPSQMAVQPAAADV